MGRSRRWRGRKRPLPVASTRYIVPRLAYNVSECGARTRPDKHTAVLGTQSKYLVRPCAFQIEDRRGLLGARMPIPVPSTKYSLLGVAVLFIGASPSRWSVTAYSTSLRRSRRSSRRG